MSGQFYEAAKFVQMLAKNSRPDQCAKIKDRVIKYAARGKIISAYCEYEGDEACPKIDQLVKAFGLVGDNWFTIRKEPGADIMVIAGLSSVARVECEPVDDPKRVTLELTEWDQANHEDGRGSVDVGKEAGKNLKKAIKTAIKFCKKGKYKGRADNVIEKVLLKDGYVVACDGVRMVRISVPALVTPAILIDRETAEIITKTDRIIEKVTYCKKWVSFHFDGAFKISAELYEYEKYPEYERVLKRDNSWICLDPIKFDKKFCEAVKAISKDSGDVYIGAGAVSNMENRDAPGYFSIELDSLESYDGLTRLDAKLLNDFLQELKEGTLSLPPAGYYTTYLENNAVAECVLMAKKL